MPEDPKGRIDILLLRLAEELGHRIEAKTRIDLKDVLKETAEQLIEDMGIPKVAVTPNSILRTAMGLDRRRKPARLRRVS